MARKQLVLQIAAIVFSLVAAGISFDLLGAHLAGASGSKLIAMGCGAEGDPGEAGCGAVITGDYGYWPPKRAGEPEGTGHIPAAFLGLIYYSAIATWMIGVGVPSRTRRWLHVLPVALMSAGLLYSVYFVYVMYAVIEQVCPWCMATHGLNLLTFACVLLAWPRRRPSAPDADVPQPATPPSSPSWRGLVATCVAVLAVVVAEAQYLKASSMLMQRDLYAAEIKRIQGDVQTMYALWEMKDRVEIEVADDEPTRFARHKNSPTCVVFSDFQCPHCQKLAVFLEERVQPMFGGHLKIIFKHYPLDKSCNDRVTTTVHPSACRASAMAEASRLIDGSAGFFKAHDYLFENQRKLGKLTIAEFAEAMSFDETELREQMGSEAMKRRVYEHIIQGRKVKLRSTPAVYLDGRRVDRLAVRNARFWDAMANSFWKKAKTKRPAATKLNKQPATRGSQDPQAAR